MKEGFKSFNEAVKKTVIGVGTGLALAMTGQDAQASPPIESKPGISQSSNLNGINMSRFWDEISERPFDKDFITKFVADEKLFLKSIESNNQCSFLWQMIESGNNELLEILIDKGVFGDRKDLFSKIIKDNQSLFWAAYIKNPYFREYINKNEQVIVSNREVLLDSNISSVFKALAVNEDGLLKILIRTGFLGDKKIVLEKIGVGGFSFFQSLLSNKNLYEYIKEMNLFLDPVFLKSLFVDNVFFLSTFLFEPVHKDVLSGILIENKVFENKEASDIFFSSMIAYKLIEILGQNPLLRDYIYESKVLLNPNNFSKVIDGNLVSFFLLLESEKVHLNYFVNNKFFENNTLLKYLFEGANANILWNMVLSGEYGNIFKTYILKEANKANLLRAYKGKLFESFSVWESKNIKILLSFVENIVYESTEQILIDIRSGEPKVTYNELMRLLNNFHNDAVHIYKGVSMRQFIVNNLKPEDKYRLIVGGIEEIYGSTIQYNSTSSFANYIFPSIFNDIMKMGGLRDYISFLKSSNVSQNINHLLVVMSRHGLFEGFTGSYGLELSEIIVETWYNINPNDSWDKINENINTSFQLIKYIKEEVKNEKSASLMYEQIKLKYLEAVSKNNKTETAILGILISMYGNLFSADEVKDPVMREVLEKFPIAKVERFTPENLFSQENGRKVHRILMPCVEGGDGDGVESCKHTKQGLHETGFKTRVENGVEIHSKLDSKTGVQVEIIAPLFNKNKISEGLGEVMKILEIDGGAVKNVRSFFYRGHSTYVPDIVRAMQDKKISPTNLFLASCGGVANLNAFYGIFPEVKFATATERTGTRFVNTPIVTSFVNLIFKNQQDGFTSEEWKSDSTKMAGGNKNFQYYDFPHENAAAAIVQAVKRYLRG